MNTYKITLLAILAALGVAGRTLLVFLPNVQPVTAIIIISGILLGPSSAIMLAILITFLSNVFLGMGIWTIWQIVSWGAIGLLSGLIGKLIRKVPLYIIVTFGVFSGYLYGLIISLTTYQVAGKFWPYYIAGLPFDTYHAIGNAIFLLVLYPTVTFLMRKYANDRFHLQQ
ncbi:MAG TPA: ECF transporter S component [Pseudogracilibacillus sp.]|nr:ECF transporter S component [Pseudogracilibacillus sp.]